MMYIYDGYRLRDPSGLESHTTIVCLSCDRNSLSWFKSSLTLHRVQSKINEITRDGPRYGP